MFHRIDIKTEPSHVIFLQNHQQVSAENTNKFHDYQNKCRCCFEAFSISSIKIPVDNVHRDVFNKLTGVELLQDSGYSMLICFDCISDMRKCQEFIDKSKNLQKEFYNFVSTAKSIPIKTEDEFSDSESVNVDAVPPDYFASDDDNNDRNEEESNISNITKECVVKLEKIDVGDYNVEEFRATIYQPTTNIREESIKPKAPRRSLTDEQKKLLMFCDKCNWSSASKRKMQHHALSHALSSGICSFCGKVPSSAKGLIAHIRRFHRNGKSKKTDCSICDSRMESNYKLEQHMQLLHPEVVKEVHCGKCNKSFYTEDALKRHEQLAHDVKVKCKDENCEKMFFDLTTMNNHYYKIHLEGTNLNIPCDICGKTYSSKSYLKIHMKSHESDGSKRYKCQVCNSEYSTHTGLRNHLMRHAKSKPDVKCEICDKMFYTKSEARSHLTSYHNGKKCPCPHCDKIFIGQDNLNVHIKFVHEKVDMKVPCEFCGKTYPTKHSMTKHVKFMHNNVQCDKCGEKFSGEEKMRRHDLVMHQNLRYKCVVPGCTKEYRSRAKAGKHLNTNHHDLNGEEKESYHEIIRKMKAEPSVKIE